HHDDRTDQARAGWQPAPPKHGIHADAGNPEMKREVEPEPHGVRHDIDDERGWVEDCALVVAEKRYAEGRFWRPEGKPPVRDGVSCVEPEGDEDVDEIAKDRHLPSENRRRKKAEREKACHERDHRDLSLTILIDVPNPIGIIGISG